jgi:Protein of unknown function (DUF3667)
MNPDLEEIGSLVSAGLAAGEIDRASPSPRTGAPSHGNCPNCGTQLNGAYCHACGQARHLHRSLLHLIEEGLHGILHFEAKGWRTLPLLIVRPGVLTRRYIDGQRTRYVSPLALFLFCVFLLFFVSSMTQGGAPPSQATAAQRARAKADIAETVNEGNAEVARATAALAQARRAGTDIAGAESDLAAAQTQLKITEMTARAVNGALAANGGAPAGDSAQAVPESWQAQLSALPIQTGFASFDAKLHHHLGNPELFLYKLKNTAYKLSFMLIPISLPFLWLMFIGRRDVAVYDHGVFSLYSLSFMALLFVAVALLGAIGMSAPASLLVIFVPPIHMFVQLRQTYGLGKFAALWRTIALLCVAGTAFALFLLFIVMIDLN